MSQTFVIVGGGLAAAKAVEGLREGGFEGRLVLYGAEHHLPYERPPLSKGYLLGNDPLESAFVHPPEWYDANGVDLRLGTRVTALDLQDRLRPHGVGVVVEAEHTCMSLRGVRAAGSSTVTSALFGSLRENPAARAEFLSLTHNRREAR